MTQTELMKIVRSIIRRTSSYKQAYELLTHVLKEINYDCEHYYQGCCCPKCADREFIETELARYFYSQALKLA